MYMALLLHCCTCFSPSAKRFHKIWSVQFSRAQWPTQEKGLETWPLPEKNQSEGDELIAQYGTDGAEALANQKPKLLVKA